MRVLHIIDSDGLYGAEAMLLGLMEEQRRDGMDPVLASIGRLGAGEKQIETAARKQGVPVIPFRMLSGPNPLGAYRLLRFARDCKFDVIHSHGYKPDILLGFTPRLMRNIRMVTTLHGWTNTRRFSRMRLYEWADRRSLRHFDRVVAVSSAMLERRRVGQDKRIRVSVVHNGIAGQNGRGDTVPESDSIVRFCRSGFTIGSVGRLSGEKGYGYLLEAVAHLCEAGVDVRLVIIGEGTQRRELTRMAEDLHLGNRVLLPGYRKQAFAYMSYMDVFVLPSLTEGLPITLLEAMRAGIPVVATGVGGIPEVLSRGRAGLVVGPASSGMLASAISHLHENPALRAELGHEGKRVVERYFSRKAMAKQYREIYEAVLSPNGMAHGVKTRSPITCALRS